MDKVKVVERAVKRMGSMTKDDLQDVRKYIEATDRRLLGEIVCDFVADMDMDDFCSLLEMAGVDVEEYIEVEEETGIPLVAMVLANAVTDEECVAERLAMCVVILGIMIMRQEMEAMEIDSLIS